MVDALRALVLGAAAGGGLPQWNCGCKNCNDARNPASPVKPASQSSLAVSGDGTNWAILNASPDIRQQLQMTSQLHPVGLRELPLRSVLLTNGDIDHVAGLLTLRERQPLTVFLTPSLFELIDANDVFRVLDRGCVNFELIGIGRRFELVPGVAAELYPVPGKVPLYMEADQDVIETDLEGDQTVGVSLSAGKHNIEYIPGCARVSSAVAERVDKCDALFFDGTVFEDDEMSATDTGTKTGGRMGHMAMNGPRGSLEVLAGFDIGRRIYIHINNTNPVWQPDSHERKLVEARGWEVAFDGMEVVL